LKGEAGVDTAISVSHSGYQGKNQMMVFASCLEGGREEEHSLMECVCFITGASLFVCFFLFFSFFFFFFFLYYGEENYILYCDNFKACARIGDKLQLVAKSNTNCKIKGQD
jgi:hypothetical protein